MDGSLPGSPVPGILQARTLECRAGELRLPHGPVATPVFMPVGTQATMKGVTAEQLDALGCRICLGNTYHLGLRPVGGLRPSGAAAAERGGAQEIP